MRKKLIGGIVAAAALVSGVTYVGPARATPAAGFTSTTIAKGTFAEFDVFNQLLAPDPRKPRKDMEVWASLQQTKGSSDLYVQSNRWEPAGSSGWHTHPGHSLIIVTAGAVTAYEGDDPACTPHVYAAGTTIVDPGNGHVHLLRNEGSVEATSITVQLIPEAASRRLDGDANPNCGF